MKLREFNRTAVAGAFAALLAAGAGLAAVGTGAIALGGGTAGNAIVSGTGSARTVTFQPDELQKAATDVTYDEDVCNSDNWLMSYAATCKVHLQDCAKTYYKDPGTVVVDFDRFGRVKSCRKL